MLMKVRVGASSVMRASTAFQQIFKWLWPIGTFRNATVGSKLERAAAYRHNWAARDCLPHYILNWFLTGTLMECTGSVLANAGFLYLATFCWLSLMLLIPGTVVIFAIYMLLNAWGP